MAELTSLLESAQRYLYPNYRQPPLVLTHGRGTEVWDSTGKRYLDFYAGIAVSALGHAHPRLAGAVEAQARKLIHIANYFYNEPNILLAEKLCKMTGFDRALFCNSGAEANEVLLKLARRHFFDKGETERYFVIAFDNSFHGRTLGALAATGQAKYRDGFGPLTGVIHVPYGDADAVKRAMSPKVAAVLVEPVQGEGGVLPAPPGFLTALRAITSEHGALLLADEVQTGFGRTGKMLGCDHQGVRPDAIAVAKALGGGVPIGAMLCREALSGALPPGSHGSTFGGNPLASSAALAVLETIEAEGLVERTARIGSRLGEQLAVLAKKHTSHVEGARGLGLLQALVLKESVDARAILTALREAGILLTLAGGQAIRFSPPLTVTEAEIDEAVKLTDQVLSGLPLAAKA